MKIYYITNSRLPSDKANGIQIAKMAEEFVEQAEEGFRLILPLRVQPESLSGVTAEDYYRLRVKLPITKIPILDLMVFINYLPKSLHYFLYLINLVSFGVSALIYCLFDKPDVIYTRDVLLLPFLLLTRKPIYYEIHYFPTKSWSLWLHQTLIPRLGGVVVINGQFINFLTKEKIYPRKALVCHNSSDPGFYRKSSKTELKNLREGLGIPADKVIFGYIGRLQGSGEDKGGSVLTQAFNLAHKENHNIVLVIVGEDGKDDRASGVYFTGNRPYKEMVLYHNLIDVALIPFPDRPHFRYFMSPLKIFDYLTTGKPIITSDFPSVREILTEQNAIFVQAGNPMSLSEALISMASAPDKMKQMGKANRTLSKRFTWTNRAKRILDFTENG